MRVLVTGGSGFLGSHVAEELKAHGDTPDCAGLIKARNLSEFDQVHTGGTLALARAALARPGPPLRRFVHVSTAGVMGLGKKGLKHTVHDSPQPVTSYGKSKLAAERALLELKEQLPITIIRPPAVYGPRDREVLAFFQMVRRMRLAPRMGQSMQAVSMIYAPDCARACVRAISADVPSGSTYFVDDGYAYTFEEMAQAIAAAYGIGLLGTPSIPIPLVRTPAFASEIFGRVTNRVMMFTRDKLPELLAEHFVVDSADAVRDLGWSPTVPFAEGARLTAAWYRQHRWD
jgi:nucleoside-diphosphate-sugar epimerase